MKCEVSELARQKHEEHQQTVSCIEAALSAGLCPECGADLELAKDTSVDFETHRCLFRKKRTAQIHRDHRVVCPNGHRLIDLQYGDRSYPGCCVWGRCLNNEIRDYHLFNYGDGDP